MPLQMTEAQAAAFFTQIKRPMPRPPGAVRAAGVAAVERALWVHAAGVRAVAGVLRI